MLGPFLITELRGISTSEMESFFLCLDFECYEIAYQAYLLAEALSWRQSMAAQQGRQIMGCWFSTVASAWVCTSFSFLYRIK